MSKHTPVAALLMLSLLLAACTAGRIIDQSPAPRTPMHSPTVAVDGLWRTDVPTLGPPRVIASPAVAVAYVAPKEGVLELRAWSVKDGSPLWSYPASPGAIDNSVTTVSPEVFSVGSSWYAVFAQSAAGDTTKAVIVDVGTGAVVTYDGSDKARRMTSLPRDCSRTTSALQAACFVEDLGNRTFQLVQVSPSGTVTTPLPFSDFAVGYEAGLWASNTAAGREGESLFSVDEGTVRWSKPYVDIFQAPVTSDWAQEWRLSVDPEIIVGYAYAARVGDASDLSGILTVGLDRATGNVVWRGKGPVMWCDYAGLSVDLGCTVEAGSQPDSSTVALTRINVGTGQSLWSAPGIIGGLTPKPRWAVTDTAAYAEFADGLKRISLTDGSITPVARDAVLAAVGQAEFLYQVGDHQLTYRAGDVYTLLDPGGQTLDWTKVTADIVKGIGVAAGDSGIFVIATTTGLTAVSVTTR